MLHADVIRFRPFAMPFSFIADSFRISSFFYFFASSHFLRLLSLTLYAADTP